MGIGFAMLFDTALVLSSLRLADMTGRRHG
jgi:hypothetical protein